MLVTGDQTSRLGWATLLLLLGIEVQNIQNYSQLKNLMGKWVKYLGVNV